MGSRIPVPGGLKNIMNWLLSGRVFRFTGISIFPKMKTGSISLSSSDMGLAANWAMPGRVVWTHDSDTVEWDGEGY